ncbi:MAG: hypothetical protein ABJN85_11645 [Gilvibacter sp.]
MRTLQTPSKGKKVQPQRNFALALYVGVVTMVTLFYSLAVTI